MHHHDVLLLFISSMMMISFVITHQQQQQHSSNDAEQAEQTVLSSGMNMVRSNRKRIVRSLSRLDEPDDCGYITIYIRESCRDDSRYPFRPVRFPYAKFNRHRFPFSRSLTRYFRSIPIYADPESKQTIIYGQSGVYLLPGLINRNRRVFSVAKLLADGFAKFSRSQTRLSRDMDVGEYAKPDNNFDRDGARFSAEAGGFRRVVDANYRSDFENDCDDDEDDESDEYENETNDSNYNKQYGPAEDTHDDYYKSQRRTPAYYIKTRRTTKSPIPATTTKPETTITPEATTTVSKPDITSTDVFTSTTPASCTALGYLNESLVLARLHLLPNDKTNKADIIKNGLDFDDISPVIVVELPSEGAVIRDIGIKSNNLDKFKIVFTSLVGEELEPVYGASASLPKEHFPLERMSSIIIYLINTTDRKPPNGVILSVDICETAPTPTTRAPDTWPPADTDTTPNFTESTAPLTTSATICVEKDVTKELLKQGLISIINDNSVNASHLMERGVSFQNHGVAFVLEMPNNGAIVRGLKLNSTNIVEVKISFTLNDEDHSETEKYASSPDTIPNDIFPKKKVTRVYIYITKVKDDQPANDITLSVIICDEQESNTTDPDDGQTILPFDCVETDVIEYLVVNDFVEIGAEKKYNSLDFIYYGINFEEMKPKINIRSPENGLTIRGLTIDSDNVDEVNIVFGFVSQTSPVKFRGNSDSLSNYKFPSEKISTIQVELTQTVDGKPPTRVTLSVVVCKEENASPVDPTACPSTLHLPEIGSEDVLKAKAKRIICTEAEHAFTLSDRTNGVENSVQKDDDTKSENGGISFNRDDSKFNFDMPGKGLIVRDAKIIADKIREVNVTFINVDGTEETSFYGKPMSLTETQPFPFKEIKSIQIQVVSATDEQPLTDVSATITVCRPEKSYCVLNPTPGYKSFISRNVITIGNFESTAKFQHNTLICGSLTVSNSSVFVGIDRKKIVSTLEVNGKISTDGSFSIDSGNLALSSKNEQMLAYLGNDKYNVDFKEVIMVGKQAKGRIYTDCDLPSRCLPVFNEINELSKLLASRTTLPKNTIEKTLTSEVLNLQLNIEEVDCNGVAVFNFEAKEIFDPNLDNTIKISSSIKPVELILLNIKGSSFTIKSSSFVNEVLNKKNKQTTVMLHFIDATQIHIDASLPAFILAPKADVKAQRTIRAPIIVNSLITNSDITYSAAIVPKYL